MIDPILLDNPIWHALTSAQRGIARAHGLAARFAPGISPLAALSEQSPQAFADLRALVAPGEVVALFTTAPVAVPEDWNVRVARYIDQMVCQHPGPPPAHAPLPLTEADVPDMLALTAATEPGPFLPHTIRMGHYVGVRAADGRLAAMAGQRLGADAFAEISAVCTDPAFRGHGHARALVAYLAAHIAAQGKTPILHVKTENGAKLLYEKLGFRVRRPIQYTVLTPL